MKSADQGVQWSGAAPASHSCACKFAQYFDGWERCLVSNCAVPTCRQERQRVCNRGSNNYHCCMNYHLNVQYKRADAWLVLRAVHAAGESGGRQWRGHAAAQGSQQWRRGHRVGLGPSAGPQPHERPRRTRRRVVVVCRVCRSVGGEGCVCEGRCFHALPAGEAQAARGSAGREVCAGVLLAQPRAMARRGRGACACTPRCALLPKRVGRLLRRAGRRAGAAGVLTDS